MAVPLHHFGDESGDAENLHLFVYGTLRSGFTNEYARRLSRDGSLLGKARIRGRLYHLGEYPGMRVLPGGDEWVTGELYQLPERSLLAELDRYEGADFRRVRCAAVLEDGRTVPASVYEYDRAVREDQRIASGDFLKP